MFGPKTLLTTVLATTALAAPSEVFSRSNTISCSVLQEDTKKPAVRYTFNLDEAKKIAKTAPAGTTNKDKSKGTTGSGYPHTYVNTDDLQWATTECRYDEKTEKTKVETLEFPISDGKDITHLYPWTEKKKKFNKVPPCRVVYARVGGAFCGVMCHKSEDTEHVKGFNMCQYFGH